MALFRVPSISPFDQVTLAATLYYYYWQAKLLGARGNYMPGVSKAESDAFYMTSRRFYDSLPRHKRPVLHTNTHHHAAVHTARGTGKSFAICLNWRAPTCVHA